MTLQKLVVSNFTVFKSLNISFAPGMNVVVGANGAGKSHLLKLAYAASAASFQAKQELKTTKLAFSSIMEEKIMDVFRADQLENLVFGRTYPTKAHVEVSYNSNDNMDLAFEIAYPSPQRTGDVKLQIGKFPKNLIGVSPVFIPTREILSIIPAFSRFHREKALLLDGTYFDLSFLAQMAKTENGHPEIAKIISKLENLLHGKVIQEAGKFFIVDKELKLEMPLVAEGLRKIAMLCCLLENSAIQPASLLLWDEPEANLNPALMVELAGILVKLSQLGTQIVVATHSLFLLREIHIRLSKENMPGRYFALDNVDNNIRLSQSDSIEEIEPITALDADLNQSDRYLALEQ